MSSLFQYCILLTRLVSMPIVHANDLQDMLKSWCTEVCSPLHSYIIGAFHGSLSFSIGTHMM
jgi:hypothetical protein